MGNNYKYILIDDPYDFPCHYKDGGSWKGICLTILNELQMKLNFTATRINISSSSYFDVINHLRNEEADFAINGFDITNDRKDQVDFITPLFSYKMTAMSMMKPMSWNSLERWRP
jgi:ABC-type amino acid transport substrate-binding protein